MMRSNYHEDWERRKTYLIRSLFQDIPVLSPVLEDPEPRYGAGSPSDISSRPHSPLPPLIIERIPNRHDHPKQFYKDLEIKMHRLYKKLFFNKESSSVDNLIFNRNRDFADDFFEEDGAHNASVSTVKLDKNRSTQFDSFSIPELSSQKSPDKNVSKGLSDNDLTLSSKAGSSISSQGSRGRAKQSRIQSLCQTQVTTVVDIHKEASSYQYETLQSPSHGIYTSPVLECRRIKFNKAVAQLEVYREERNQKQHGDVNNDTTGAETLGSANDEDSSKEVLSEKLSLSEISNKSIEIMRRQKDISLTLGSLQNELFVTTSSKRSSSCTNIELHRKISLDLPEENNTNESQSQRNIRDMSFSSVTDFSNIVTTSTPKHNQSIIGSSCKSNKTGKRVRTESTDGDDEDDSIMITKRRKCKNISIQTSLISESDVEDIIDWSQIKYNFFVGTPRIYKLLPCNACSKF